MKTFHEVLNPPLCVCNPDIRKAEIHKLPFLQTASRETVDGFYRFLRSAGFKEGEEFSPLKYRDGVFGIVARGTFKVYRPVGEEEFVIFDILSAGDFFLFGDDSSDLTMFRYPDQIQSLTTACVLFMERPSLEKILAADARLMGAFFAALTKRLSYQSERFIRFMAFAAEQRLAFLLGYLWGKGPKKTTFPNLIPFNLTRKDLAAMAGLTLETVSRVLSSFERDGLVRSGRGWIEILDHPKLADLSSHLIS